MCKGLGTVPAHSNSFNRCDHPLGYGFPHSSVSKESVCNAGGPRLIPGLGRSPAAGNGNPLQYSCLEDPTDRRAWQTTVYAVARVRHEEQPSAPTPLGYRETGSLDNWPRRSLRRWQRDHARTQLSGSTSVFLSSVGPGQDFSSHFLEITPNCKENWMHILGVIGSFKIHRFCVKPVGHYKSSAKRKVHSNTGIPQETRKKSNK